MQVTLRQFVKDLRTIIGQENGTKAVQLGKGQIKDMEEYKKIVGWIAGMDAAGDLADRMLRQMEESEEQASLPAMDPRS